MRSHSSATSNTKQSKPPRPKVDFEALVLHLPTPVVLADQNGNIVYRNDAVQAWLGEGLRLETLFQDLLFLSPFEGWVAVVQRALVSGDGAQLRCQWPRRDLGTAATGSLVIGPAHTATPRRGRCAATSTRNHVVITLIEGAPAAAADESHEMSRRLASLGKLAARVAHELNNPLDGILRYINLALRIVGDAPEPKLRAYLAESRTGLMRMVQIIGDLLDYTRSTAGEFDDVGVNEVIEEAIRSLSAAADERRIVVAVDFQHRDMPKVRGSRLYQVLCNLLRNAVDAMPQGGRLTVTSGLVDGFVVIRVADTGVGLPEPVVRVFEPFFTTKPPGQGTGLGLAISKDFIEEMGGAIRGENQTEGGAVFTVRLPVDGLETQKHRNTETQKHRGRAAEGERS